MPFIIHSETSTPIVEPVERMFKAAVRKGASRHPHDKGGLTMCGVTLSTFREYCRRKASLSPLSGAKSPNQLSHSEDMEQNLTFEVWTDIYKTMFWDRWKADSILSERVAAALVDWTWVSGVNGIRLPQRLLGVTPDGVVGPNTLKAVNSRQNTDRLLQMIQDSRKAYHNSIAPDGSRNRTFLRGWNARVDRLTTFLKTIKA